MFNLFGKKPAIRRVDSADDCCLNLDSSSSQELRRVTVDPSSGLPQDSAIIPNIEARLRGRSDTDVREILRNPFDDSVFRT